MVPSTPAEFKARINKDGLWAALRWLNARVPYRYSAVFAFDRDMLRSLCLVDKTDPSITRCPDQPITESYCLYVQRTSTRFSVEEALVDPRVTDHPKRASYQCYYGVPLFSTDGKILGTICHFDIMPRAVTPQIAETLDQLAPLIVEAAFPT
jgi:GAF domain-containing protein